MYAIRSYYGQYWFPIADLLDRIAGFFGIRFGPVTEGIEAVQLEVDILVFMKGVIPNRE